VEVCGAVEEPIPGFCRIRKLFPHAQEDSPNTSDAIFAVLRESPDLTAKQIYFRVQRVFRANVSYAGVHKTLQTLVMQGVLEKNGRHYCVRAQWARELGKLAQDLETGSSGNLLLKCELGGGIATVGVDSIASLDRLLTTTYRLTKNLPAYAECSFLNWALSCPQELIKTGQFSAVKEKTHTLCKSNTPIDDWCKDLELELGMKTATGCDCALAADLHSVGDYVIVCTYPAESVAAIKKVYGTVKEACPETRKRVYANLSPILTKRQPVQISIVKDKGWAEGIKKNVLKQL